MSLIHLFRRRLLTADKYRRAFRLCGVSRPAGQTLVHPGFPSPDSVTLWYAREAGAQAPATVAASFAGDGDKLQRAIIHHSFRHVGRVRIEGLEPSTRYLVTLMLDGVASAPIPLCTAPSERDAPPFSFLAYSCFSPFPKSGHSLNARTVHCLNLLAQRSEPASEGSVPAPAFALGMGDQVYVDDGVIPFPPARAMLYGWRSQYPRYPKTRARDFFDILYDAYFRLEPFERSLRALPHAMMWDDHDIRDGWGSQLDEGDIWRDHLNAAREAFLSYQVLRNPAPVAYPDFNTAVGATWEKRVAELLDIDASPTQRPELHFQFQWGAATHFLVLDLRSQRQADPKAPRVITERQLAALDGWLSSRVEGQLRPRLYVLVTPIPLTHAADSSHGPASRAWFRADDRRDSWWSQEARGQRDEILKRLRAHFLRNPADRLLVLSGDVHFAEVLTLSLVEGGARRVFGHEVISSGLAQSAFYGRGSRLETQADFEPIAGLHSQSAGSRLFAPHFAEIFVGPGTDATAPSVHVSFYPATRNQFGALVNPPGRLAELLSSAVQPDRGRLELQVGTVEPTTFDSFARFMLPDRLDEAPPRWNAKARGWSLPGVWNALGPPKGRVQRRGELR
jgi:phosphodiesterase/alkaline phosphatase D-like protein